jgi:Bifunctional DNA primase/polymerase, N-terminal
MVLTKDHSLICAVVFPIVPASVQKYPADARRIQRKSPRCGARMELSIGAVAVRFLESVHKIKLSSQPHSNSAIRHYCRLISTGRSLTQYSRVVVDNAPVDAFMPTDRKLEQALLHVDLGLHVFPCHSVLNGQCTCGQVRCGSPGKHPRTRKGCKEASQDPATILSWWEKWPEANIGVATGNGLMVVDVDPDRGGDVTLANLEAEYGSLPQEWVVETGGGGRHFYLATPPRLEIRTLRKWQGQGVELQGKGAYVVAPPSDHASGNCYSWSRPIRLPGPPPVPQTWLNLWPAPRSQSALPRRGRSPSRAIASSTVSLSVDTLPDNVRERIATAVRRTTVNAPGTRNRKLVELGRQLYRIPELRCFDLEDTEPFFNEWFARSLPKICTKDRRVSWREWVVIWCDWLDAQKIGEPLELALELAESEPMPKCAKRYKSRKQRLLVQFCRHLELNSGGNWFLSCRKAGELLEVDFMVANRWLRELVRDGVLETPEPHRRGSMKAARYRYCGDELEAAA